MSKLSLAIADQSKSTEMCPISHFYLAAALAALGRLDEARAEVHAGLTLDPKFTIRRFRAGAPTDNPVFLKQRERVIEAMRKAGAPEG